MLIRLRGVWRLLKVRDERAVNGYVRVLENQFALIKKEEGAPYSKCAINEVNSEN